MVMVGVVGGMACGGKRTLPQAESGKSGHAKQFIKKYAP